MAMVTSEHQNIKGSLDIAKLELYRLIGEGIRLCGMEGWFPRKMHGIN